MSAQGSGGRHGAGHRPTLVAVLAILVGVLGIAWVQPALATRMHAVTVREDVFALPPPKQLKAMSFGYHAAACDLVWAKLLLEYGVHWQEKRRFTEAPRFADAILELDPKYANLYKYIDTILVYQPGPGNHSYGGDPDARAARAYLERGLKERPFDSQLWLHYGQFIAFSGQEFLETNDAEKQAWRRDGALAIGHAMELGARVDHTMAAASILGRAGEREAAVRYLERAYALADTEDQRREIVAQLSRYRASAAEDAEASSTKRLDTMRRRSYPFLSRGEFLLLGPMPDAATCVGRPTSAECATNWATALDRP